jgi:hypothetical protein
MIGTYTLRSHDKKTSAYNTNRTFVQCRNYKTTYEGGSAMKNYNTSQGSGHLGV